MTLNSPKFTKINESFRCLVCHFQVPKAQVTCRDHCPKCLCSLHVDNNPGDRESICHGVLKPVSYSQNKKKGIMIHYVCEKCCATKVNKFLEHDIFCPDDYEKLLSLTSE